MTCPPQLLSLLLPLLQLLSLLPAGAAPLLLPSPPAPAPAWRNDSQNIALVDALQQYVAAQLLSDQFGGDNISDAVPVQLGWSLLGDMPYPWKDGVGCYFEETGDVVLAGGLWQVWSGEYSHAINTTMVYRLANNTWDSGPRPPFLVGRTQGACSDTALFIAGGAAIPGLKNPSELLGRRSLRLRQDSEEWDVLPELPADGQRYAGASAHVADKWLLVGMGVPTVGPGTAMYRLQVGSTGPAVGSWTQIPPLPVCRANTFPLW